MNISDFKTPEVFDYETRVTIWGREIGIGVDCCGSSLEDMLPKIDKLVKFLEGSRDRIAAALVAADFLNLAEDWVSGAEEAEESTAEHECYILEDGSKVYLPITEEAFAKSLCFNSLSVYFDEKAGDISADVFLDCKPDYFACHSIEIFVGGDLTVKVNGLAG